MLQILIKGTGWCVCWVGVEHEMLPSLNLECGTRNDTLGRDEMLVVLSMWLVNANCIFNVPEVLLILICFFLHRVRLFQLLGIVSY